jgi:hypothetical protein
MLMQMAGRYALQGTGLFTIAIVAVLAASCDLNGSSTNASNLDGREQDEDPMDPNPGDPMDPTDPGDPGDPQPPPEEPCDPPLPVPNECELSGSICLPLDPFGTGLACPEGLVELPFGCPYDEAGMIASVCCGFGENPQPEPDPCAWAGGVCWAADEFGNVSCPEGLEPRYDVPCFIEDGSGSFSVCCAFIEEPPPPPSDECPDPSDPSVRYVGQGPEVCEAIEYLCTPDSRPFDSPCGCGCIYPGEDPGRPPEEPACPDPNAANVIYVSEDLAVCNTISYTCPSNHVVFTSPCGCGCLGY